MEPKNHPLQKDIHLPNLHFEFHPFIFQSAGGGFHGDLSWIPEKILPMKEIQVSGSFPSVKP